MNGSFHSWKSNRLTKSIKRKLTYPRLSEIIIPCYSNYDGRIIYDIAIGIFQLPPTWIVDGRRWSREHRERCPPGSIAGVRTLNPSFMRFPCKRTAFTEIYYLTDHLYALLAFRKTTTIKQEFSSSALLIILPNKEYYF